MNIAGGTILHHARFGLALVFKKGYTVLYAKDEDDCKRWYNALKIACNHVLGQYYVIKQKIGTGGFASVRLGMDKETKQLVAVKTIKKGERSPSFLRREADILKVIDHPNVVDTLDIFETDREFHIVMEYMKGGMLSSVSNEKLLYSENEIRTIMRHVLQGVAYLHSQGVVHRDLKPENILLTEYCGTEVKVADFGLSKFYDNSSEILMGTLIGTPEFVAPELVQNEKYGVEVDLWAIGIIMYNLVTGTLPFHEDEVLQIYKDGDFQIFFSAKVWGEISHDAERLVRQLLCPDASKRLTAVSALNHDWFTRHSNSRHAVNPKRRRNLRSVVYALIFASRISRKEGVSMFVDEITPELQSASSLASISSGISCVNSEWEFVPEEFKDETQSFRELDSFVTTRTSMMMMPGKISKEKRLQELSARIRDPMYLAANSKDRNVGSMKNELDISTSPVSLHEIEPLSSPMGSTSQKAISLRTNLGLSGVSSFAKKKLPRTFTFAEFHAESKGINSYRSIGIISSSSDDLALEQDIDDAPKTENLGRFNPKSVKKAKEWLRQAFTKRRNEKK